MREAIWRLALFLLFILCLGLSTGCAPEFTSAQCSTDANCFADEQCGSAGVCVPRTTTQPFSIVSFTSSADTIDKDDAAITLSWEILGDVATVNLTDQTGKAIAVAMPRAKTNSVTVSLSQTTTFTLSATSSQGGKKDSKTLTVTRPTEPAILLFAASPVTIAPGQGTTLSWETRDAQAIDISSAKGEVIELGGKDVAKDSVVVSPTETTVYTLRAVGSDDASVTQAVSVVVEAPEVLSATLTASTTRVTQGDSLTLSWVSTGAAELMLTSSDGTLLDLTNKNLEADTITVIPRDPMTTYTLRATGTSEPVESSVTITVDRLDVGIISFLGAPDSLTTGESVTLTYETTGITTLSIKAVGATSGTERQLTVTPPFAAGMVTDTPTESTIYTLTASDGTDTFMRTVTVSVFPLPLIVSFATDSMALIVGDLATLSWEVGPYASVMLTATRAGQTTMVAITTDKATGTGSVTVSPAEDTEYTLVVTSGAGKVAMESVLVGVTPVALQITEVLRNVSAGADMRQWVEVYNPTDRLVPLSAYTVAGGQTMLTQTSLPLTGQSIPPRGCLLIGGPMGLPMGISYDVPADFAPDLPTADGVIALLYGSADALIDTVVFGAASFPGEDGAAVDMERTPLEPADTSVIRISDSDVFSLMLPTSPGRCFEVVDVAVPATGLSNQSVAPIEFDAYGFDARTMVVTLGANVQPNCTQPMPGKVRCDANLTGLVGPQDLVVTKDKEVVLDAMGAIMIQPLMGQAPASTPISVTLNAQDMDASPDFFCGIVDAGPLSLPAGMPATASLKILSVGDTDGPGEDIPAGWRVEMALIATNALPYVARPLLDWVLATKSGTSAPAVLYDASITSAMALTGELAFRIKRDVADSYVYCDLDTAAFQGSDNGWNAGGGLQVSWTP